MPSASVQAPVALHLGVTITTFVLVGILFVAVYVQLLMVLCLGHKLISYQTLLFFDILLWATFRLTLYSFYFYHCCELLNELSTFSEWLLVDFPSALQYLSLAVLVHFFGGVSTMLNCAEKHVTFLWRFHIAIVGGTLTECNFAKLVRTIVLWAADCRYTCFPCAALLCISKQLNTYMCLCVHVARSKSIWLHHHVCIRLQLERHT